MLFNILYYDIIEIIILHFSNLIDVINLSNTNKYLNLLFNDRLYTSWGRYIYSDEFWLKAKSRTPILSKPLPNMKLELLRLYNFEKEQLKYRHQLWSKKDYYMYWHSLEENNNKSLKKCL